MNLIINKNNGIAGTSKKGFYSFYTKGEEIFNAVSHIVGGALGLAVLITLCIFSYPSAVKITASVHNIMHLLHRAKTAHIPSSYSILSSLLHISPRFSFKKESKKGFLIPVSDSIIVLVLYKKTVL